MELIYLINIAVAIWCWKVAQDCEIWSIHWWICMFASALNAAVVLDHFI